MRTKTILMALLLLVVVVIGIAWGMGRVPKFSVPPELPSVNNKIFLDESGMIILEKDAFIRDELGRTFEPKEKEKMVRIYNDSGDLATTLPTKYAPEDILIYRGTLFVSEKFTKDDSVCFLIEQFTLDGKEPEQLNLCFSEGLPSVGRAPVIDVDKDGNILLVIADEKQGISEIWKFDTVRLSWGKIYRYEAKKIGG
ncbi:MAG: hypothetical protein KKH83_03650 [Candidatus Margulisbacteria bacterium]|nr:hypothetical protein [Candidatus Margulisiibacteriota bacterium]